MPQVDFANTHGESEGRVYPSSGCDESLDETEISSRVSGRDVTKEGEGTLWRARLVGVSFRSDRGYSQKWGHKQLTRSQRKGSYGFDQHFSTVKVAARKTNAYATVPTRMYAIRAPAGPAVARTKPEFKKRPVPNVPAIAILHHKP